MGMRTYKLCGMHVGGYAGMYGGMYVYYFQALDEGLDRRPSTDELGARLN